MKNKKNRTIHIAAAAAGLAAFALVCMAQAPPQPAPVAVTHVRGAVYFATGGAGSNSGIIVGSTGVILVDAKITADSEKDVVAEVAKLTQKPITHIIVTHSDGDHINGIPALPAGVKIIAHANAKKEIEDALAGGGRGAPPKEAVPTQVVTKNREDMTIDGVKLTLYHWTNAHTSGDLVIVVDAERVGFGGDIIATNRPDPIIHAEKNGSSLGWIESVKGMLALDADTWVPGHGDLLSKSDLSKRLADVQARRDKIAAGVAAGQSLDAIKTTLGETPAPAAPGGRGGMAPFTDTVYGELTKK